MPNEEKLNVLNGIQINSSEDINVKINLTSFDL